REGPWALYRPRPDRRAAGWRSRPRPLPRSSLCCRTSTRTPPRLASGTLLGSPLNPRLDQAATGRQGRTTRDPGRPPARLRRTAGLVDQYRAGAAVDDSLLDRNVGVLAAPAGRLPDQLRPQLVAYRLRFIHHRWDADG